MKPQNKILLYGPPGCGKTLIARALSKELDMPLALVRFDSVISSYLGQTGNNMRKIFEFAKKNECILFFDEFDAVGKLRDDNQELGELKRVVITLLQNFDYFSEKSILICATNHEHLLDPALWRRFDLVLNIGVPMFEQRLKIVESNLKMLNYGFNNNLSSFLTHITEGLSGASITQIIENSLRKILLNNQLCEDAVFIEEVLRIRLIDNYGEKNSNESILILIAKKLRELDRAKYTYDKLEKLLGIPHSTLNYKLNKS